MVRRLLALWTLGGTTGQPGAAQREDSSQLECWSSLAIAQQVKSLASEEGWSEFGPRAAGPTCQGERGFQVEGMAFAKT